METWRIERANRQFLSIDEQRRRSIDAERSASELISGDSFLHLLAVHVFLETIDIDSQRFRQVCQGSMDITTGRPGKSIVIQQIVHFPESVLQSGGFRRAGCL